MIHFNVPTYVGNELEYIKQAIESHKICGDGLFTHKCQEYLQNHLENNKVLLTNSCTAALEISSILCDIKPGDEVILPSYTFCSTANAFVQRGAKLVFVDIRPDTMNIDETKIEAAITEKTKVIIPVHYAGIACEMDIIINLARKYNLKVVEDSAQAIFSTYKGSPLGTIGDYGCLSFHETKNFSMGEGGAIIINSTNEDFERAEIIREKGTDRNKFLRGQVDKYTWRDCGSSYIQSDINAAYLWAQLEAADSIQKNRISTWNKYYEALKPYDGKKINLPFVPEYCTHNAHIFYLRFFSPEERNSFIKYMNQKEIQTFFHYIPLHSSPAGLKFGRFNGEDVYTTKESQCLVRLPLYYNMKSEELDRVIDCTISFLEK